MNDAQSTIVGLKSQDCPGGGWTGQPAAIERATVADCLAHGVCGCIYGDAVQNIERLRAAAGNAASILSRHLSHQLSHQESYRELHQARDGLVQVLAINQQPASSSLPKDSKP